MTRYQVPREETFINLTTLVIWSIEDILEGNGLTQRFIMYVIDQLCSFPSMSELILKPLLQIS